MEIVALVQKKLKLPICVALIGLSIMASLGSLGTNLLWVDFNRQKQDESKVSFSSEDSGKYVNSVLIPLNEQTLYLGYARYSSGNVPGFFTFWNNTQLEPTFFENWGDYYYLNKDFENSLSYYILAAKKSTDPDIKLQMENKSAISCQLLRSQQNLPEFSSSFCNNYFQKNDLNLFVDGDGVAGNLDYWKYRFFEKRNSATYYVRFNQSLQKNVFELTGLGNQYHGGVYQRIALEPGACIHYSAHVKLEGNDNFSSRLLYIGGESDGQPIGSQLLTADINSNNFEFGNWVYIERYIRVPKADENLFEFYPVLISGEGTVLIDNVRLTEINKSQFCP